MFNTSFLNSTVFLGVLRQLLTAGATLLTGAGILSGDEANTAVGALVALISIAFSIYANRNHAVAKVAIENEGKEVIKVGSLATSQLVDKVVKRV